MSSVCDSYWSRDYHDDIRSRVLLSETRFILGITRIFRSYVHYLSNKLRGYEEVVKSFYQMIGIYATKLQLKNKWDKLMPDLVAWQKNMLSHHRCPMGQHLQPTLQLWMHFVTSWRPQFLLLGSSGQSLLFSFCMWTWKLSMWICNVNFELACDTVWMNVAYSVL